MVAVPPWCPPPDPLLLADDEVHVWRAALTPLDSDLRNMWHTLSADERERAERFYFSRDRKRFIAARGVLRAILSRYLAIGAEHLCFCYNARGKPALTSDSGGDTLRFNVSHSHTLALFAVTRGREVGIDLERMRSDLADEQIARRFFSPHEVAMLRALPPELRREGFFNCWTRKEAYIKARGEGLALPLDQFDVTLAPGESARLLSTAGDPQEADRWSLQALFPGQDYAAALAVEGHAWRLQCWQWMAGAE